MKLLETFSFGRLIAIIITLIGLVGASLTIYAFFFQEKKIDLQFEILANSNVLDIKAEITKLDILYDGSSLKQKKQNLRIVNLRIINTGTEHILNTFYDDNDPLGLKVVNGKIIEIPEVLDAGNEYLKKNLTIKLDSDSLVRFSKVIIESKEFFVIKVLILHSYEEIPRIFPVGKIAGVRRIELTNKIESSETKSFIKEILGGNLWVQIARSLSYFLIALIAIILNALSVAVILNLKDKVKRKKVVKNFISTSGLRFTRMDDVIFKRYKVDGPFLINRINESLSDEKVLNNDYQKLQKGEKKLSLDKDNSAAYRRGGRFWDLDFYPLALYNIMIDDGFVIK